MSCNSRINYDQAWRISEPEMQEYMVDARQELEFVWRGQEVSRLRLSCSCGAQYPYSLLLSFLHANHPPTELGRVLTVADALAAVGVRSTRRILVRASRAVSARSEAGTPSLRVYRCSTTTWMSISLLIVYVWSNTKRVSSTPRVIANVRTSKQYIHHHKQGTMGHIWMILSWFCSHQWWPPLLKHLQGFFWADPSTIEPTKCVIWVIDDTRIRLLDEWSY